MPLRPPSHCPTMTRNSVSAVSKNVVRRILMGPSPFLEANSRYLIRYELQRQVVSAPRAQIAWLRSCRHDPPERDLPATPCLQESAARVDPESCVESYGATAARRTPGRSLRSGASPSPLA